MGASDEEILRAATQKVLARERFFSHLVWFFFLNLSFFLLNLWTGLDRPWFLWILFFWGIALLLHFASAFILTDLRARYRPEAIEREVRTRRGAEGQAP
ncbi:MAG: 2TM domain-containing protein [Planctomycetes bacterium]|nr:2TM domain-containing protein [Planctomycetota bacterium]